METNQATSKTERVFDWLTRVSRIILLISSTLLIISIISLLIFRRQCFSIHSHAGVIIWPAIMITIFSLLYSAIMIIVSSIYHISKRQPLWAIIKKDVLFIILTGLLMTIFYFLNSYTISNYL